MKHLPADTVSLIERLEEDYPARCIAEDQTELQAHRYAGKVELIGWLRDNLNATEKKQLAARMKA